MSNPILALNSDTQIKNDISTIQSESYFGKYENNEEITSFIQNNIDNSLEIQWSVTIEYNEPGNQYAYSIFGEAPDASDGQDSYDIPLNPPSITPYIRAWFDAGLASPYDSLLADFRFYPDNYKKWNLSVQWVPSDYVSPTDITISWDTNEVDNSEYNKVLLYDDNNLLKNMLVDSSYTYNSPALVPMDFYILCQVNSPPIMSDEIPSNGANDISIDLEELIINIEDSEGDNFDWSIVTDPDIGSSSGFGENNGTKYCSVSGLGYSTTYSWTVTATDPGGSGETTEEVYTFTTESETNSPPEFLGENPSNGASDVSIDLAFLSVYIEDIEGNSFDWSIVTDPDIGSSSGFGENNGTKYCSVSGLSYSTTYSWTVTATDPGGSGETTEEVYVFTTENDNEPPNTPNKPTGPTELIIGELGEFCTSASDPDGDQIQYRFDWDDGTYSEWSDNVPSGAEVCMTYYWGLVGNYAVRAQARDQYGEYSDWSNPLYVEVVGENDPPSIPTKPSGPTELIIGQIESFTSDAIDPDGDMVQIRFDWNDGNISDWTEVVESGVPVSKQYSWTNIGTYKIKAQARDIYNALSGWSDYLVIEVKVAGNQPPNIPIIDGPTTGAPGIKYTFNAYANDPDGDQISYYWDWDDDSYSGWLGPYNSGNSCEASHVWAKNNYIIRVKAKDINGLESDWGELEISIPRNKNNFQNVFYNLFYCLTDLIPILKLLVHQIK